MKTAEIIEMNDGQAVRLPEDFRFHANRVAIRRQGDGVILEPLKPATWPTNFFAAIHIDDPGFARPDQGSMPPAPSLE